MQLALSPCARWLQRCFPGSEGRWPPASSLSRSSSRPCRRTWAAQHRVAVKSCAEDKPQRLPSSLTLFTDLLKKRERTLGAALQNTRSRYRRAEKHLFVERREIRAAAVSRGKKILSTNITISGNVTVTRPTGLFELQAHFGGPARRVDCRTPYVAPEVGGVLYGEAALLGEHQAEAAAGAGVDPGRTRPARLFGVEHLDAGACSDGGLQALCQLGTERDKREREKPILFAFNVPWFDSKDAKEAGE